MRRPPLVVMALILGVALALHPWNAIANGPWGQRADSFIERAEADDINSGTAANYADLAAAIALRYGWDDPRVATHIDRVMAMRNPDGGWGLPYSWDAFQDGTTNPATTTYTVSTAAVGDVLLEAYKAGKVERAVIASVITRLYKFPKLPGIAPGYCIAYSASLNDVKPGYCVHNVSAGVAGFLIRAQAAGFTVSSAWLTLITRYELATYDHPSRNWRYMDGNTVWSDPAHTGYSVTSLQVLAPAIARDAVVYHLGRDLPDPRDVWLHLYLAPFDCGRAGQWLTEVDAEFAKPGNSIFGLLVQGAHLSAKTAKACE